jgi:hypothetical protein
MSPDQPTPSGKTLMRRTLYLGSALLAWCALLVLLWLADITNLAETAWPASLNKTLAYVMAAYVGSKASSRWRGFKLAYFPACA